MVWTTIVLQILAGLLFALLRFLMSGQVEVVLKSASLRKQVTLNCITKDNNSSNSSDSVTHGIAKYTHEPVVHDAHIQSQTS